MTSPHISPVRIPDLVGALNFRDMGGYPGTSWFDGVAREIWEPIRTRFGRSNSGGLSSW